MKLGIVDKELLGMHGLPPAARLTRHTISIAADVQLLRGSAGGYALDACDEDHVGLANASRRVQAELVIAGLARRVCMEESGTQLRVVTQESLAAPKAVRLDRMRAALVDAALGPAIIAIARHRRDRALAASPATVATVSA
eukprot:CAMPEP_0174750024 /NCGR_PEP_ID=MMETSP1094-20130205/96909_1 /TAXON_ID=156173 /ORGANISM="Chrysochromulina brevifilum, Strain UTEX LB 985" /LENGTH=140 /DNA_ID=CAMNT_0015955321 /DNA_START=9 /DNA_END=427 /DNA_ORIENTATION=+